MTSSILQPSDLQSAFCGYWNANDLVWSSKGCRLNKEFSDNEKTVCECFHLTRFDLIASLTLMFDNYLRSQLAHRYAIFFCSLDNSLVGQLTSSQHNLTLAEIPPSLLNPQHLDCFNKMLMLMFHKLNISTASTCSWTGPVSAMDCQRHPQLIFCQRCWILFYL